MESQRAITALSLQVLLDILEVLTEIRDQTKNVVIDFVPPDYREEGKSESR